MNLISTVVLLAFLGLSVAGSIPKAQYKFRNIYAAEPKSPVKNDPHPRIVGGQEATPHSLPYQALVTFYAGNSGWYCGGSLISPSLALTSANCAMGSTRADVTLGAHNINEDEDTQVVVSSVDIIVHPEYNSYYLRNDIAIIKLLTPVSLNENIAVVPLPPNDNETFAGSVARTSGWGSNSGSSSKLTDVLNYVDTLVITNSECSTKYFNIVASHICTSGDVAPGSCNGDSGDPITVDGVLVGVVAFGEVGCRLEFPTGGTRVSSYLEWIAENS